MLLFIAMHYWGYTSLEVKGRWGLLLPPCLLTFFPELKLVSDNLPFINFMQQPTESHRKFMMLVFCLCVFVCLFVLFCFVCLFVLFCFVLFCFFVFCFVCLLFVCFLYRDQLGSRASNLIYTSQGQRREDIFAASRSSQASFSWYASPPWNGSRLVS